MKGKILLLLGLLFVVVFSGCTGQIQEAQGKYKMELNVLCDEYEALKLEILLVEDCIAKCGCELPAAEAAGVRLLIEL